MILGLFFSIAVAFLNFFEIHGLRQSKMKTKRPSLPLAASILLVAPLVGQVHFERDAGFVFGVPVAMDGTGVVVQIRKLSITFRHP